MPQNVFEIRNAEGKAIPINELDRQAATVWGKEVLDREYATPLTIERGTMTIGEYMKAMMSNTNWFDYIGWTIAYNKLTTWDQVRMTILTPFTKIMEEHNITSDQLLEELPAIKKYFGLIEHWRECGYSPIGFEE